MSEGHTHIPRAGQRHLRSLAIAFTLVAGFMVVEVIAGFWTGSLALLSDAGHMATDALGLGMALAAIIAADNTTEHPGRTYGLYRTEILAALANAILLFGVAGYVIFEALRRLGDPPDVLPVPMLVVAVIGLVINLVGLLLLRKGSSESFNIEGAYLEVIADLIGSVGVIVAALIIQTTGWAHADPLFGAVIGLFILPRAWRLARKAIRVLVQAAPEHLDLEGLAAELRGLPEVADVHDMHVWTLTSDMDVATVHLMIKDGADPHPVLDRARSVLEDHRIAHATLQVEPDTHRGCAELSW